MVSKKNKNSQISYPRKKFYEKNPTAPRTSEISEFQDQIEQVEKKED